MQQIIEGYVLNAGDHVKQLVAATKAAQTFKNMADNVRKEATKDVRLHLTETNRRDFRGTLDWNGTPICIRHKVSYAWENYRCPRKEEERTPFDLQVETLLQQRLFANQLLSDAQRQALVVQGQVRAAKSKLKESDEALAVMLPDSKCIHDEIELVVL